MRKQGKRKLTALAFVGVFLIPVAAYAYTTEYATQDWNNVIGDCDIRGQHWRETVGDVGTALTAEIGNTCYRLDVWVNWYHEDFGWLNLSYEGTVGAGEKRVDVGGITNIDWTKHRGCTIPNGVDITCSVWKGPLYD